VPNFDTGWCRNARRRCARIIGADTRFVGRGDNMRSLLVVTCLAAGCVNGALPIDGADDSGAPSEDMTLGTSGSPPAGIYRVDVSPARGDCVPQTLTGPLPQPVQVFGGLEPNGALRVSFPYFVESVPFTYLESLSVKDGTLRLNPDTCGASQSVTVTVTGMSDSAYSVTRSSAWTNTAAIDRRAVCLAGVPQADCHTSAEVRYTLLQACPPPCVVRESESPSASFFGTLECVCNGPGAP
jgi:hypothetical protein